MLTAWITKYWIPITLFILTLITILSLIPLAELPPVPGSDKTQHLIAYGVLMMPTAIKKSKYTGAIAFGFAGWSGAIELIQPYVNRYGEMQDLAANIMGLILGWLVIKLIERLFLK